MRALERKCTILSSLALAQYASPSFDLLSQHALSLVGRLLEKSPSSILSDQQHIRLDRIRKDRTRASAAYKVADGNSERSILVIDKSGDSWMQRWNRSFEAYHNL